MTCEEALRKLYEVIDKEASEIDAQEVKEHLRHCRSCMARYQFEEMFKTFVIDKASSPAKSEFLKGKIISQIQHLDENPGSGKNRGKFLTNPFRFRSIFVAVAAALVLCVLAAFASAKFYRHKVFIYPFEKTHMTVHALYPDKIPHNTEAVSKFLNGDMRLAVNDLGNGFSMIGCCFDEVQGQRFAHLRYQNGLTHVSLYIGKNDGVNLPDFEKAVANNIEYFHRECKECLVMYWKMGDALVIAVTDDKQARLTDFLPALASI